LNSSGAPTRHIARTGSLILLLHRNPSCFLRKALRALSAQLCSATPSRRVLFRRTLHNFTSIPSVLLLIHGFIYKLPGPWTPWQYVSHPGARTLSSVEILTLIPGFPRSYPPGTASRTKPFAWLGTPYIIVLDTVMCSDTLSVLSSTFQTLVFGNKCLIRPVQTV
jgi:hypothetical protein